MAARASCRIPVLAPDGQPLTPARPERVRCLLDTGRARVRWLTGRVFTIQLLAEPSGREIVPLLLGIDDGGRHAALSVVMARAKRPPQVVVSVQAELPDGIKRRMDQRRSYRRQRRCRKGYLLRVTRTLLGFLPIADVTVEVGAFDLQALAGPDLSGAQYQQGPRYGHDSTLAALVAAYGAQCCYCGKPATPGDPLTIDHWRPRAQGGTDRWGNLVAAHRSCNEAKGARTPAEAGFTPRYEPRDLRETALAGWAARTQQGKRYLAHGLYAMGLRYRETFGTFTAWQRRVLGAEKTHRSDARIIALSRYSLGKTQTEARPASPAQPGIALTAHLRAAAGHARHQGTGYRVRSASETGWVLLSVRTPDGIKTKTSTTVQVQASRHGAALRTEVNRAVVTGVGRKVTVVRVGEPVPTGVPVWSKGMAVRATVRGRSVVGIITGLKSRGTVVMRAVRGRSR